MLNFISTSPADPATPAVSITTATATATTSYVDRGPARKEYVEAFWTVVNWDQVRMNYAAAVGGKVNNIVS